MREHLLNVAGIVLGFFILFFGLLFALWQLDMIVSGPVWWSSEPYGMGTGWSHPNGAYQLDYFQCFLWRTTIGQAYDTLFLIAYVTPIIGTIVIFLSVWFWNDCDAKHPSTVTKETKVTEMRFVSEPLEEIEEDDDEE